MSSRNSSLEMIKLGLILSLFAAASCTVLALVNSVTSVKIAENKINAKGHSPAEMTAQEKCIGCAFCATMCPDCVITVEK